ncbi:MAG: twin-arginine translocase subunit TatC [Bacteroidia bacterium]
MSEGKEMSFLGHLEELRWRLFRSAIAVVIFALLLFVFTESIIETVYISMSSPDFYTYKFFCLISEKLNMGDVLCASSINLQLQSTQMMGQFTTNMYFALIGGVVLAFPFIFFQLWSFVKPALKQNERSVSKGVIFWGTFLFFLGIAFGYFLISPLCVQFFGNYSMSDAIKNDFTINSYISVITTTTFFSGLFFELPILIYMLTKLGVVSPEVLKKIRKHAMIVILILSAIITPPDVISQIIVAIPIMGLYEIGILVSKRVVKNKLHE